MKTKFTKLGKIDAALIGGVAALSAIIYNGTPLVASFVASVWLSAFSS